MDKMNFSLGASGKKKPIKKEIDINVGVGHIILFFLFLIIIIVAIIKIFIFFGVGVDSMAISCINGSIETVEANKFYYCGQYYTNVEEYIGEYQFKYMEEIIWNQTNNK